MKSIRLVLSAAVVTGLLFAQPPAAAILSVEGNVSTPLSLTIDDLAKMPRQSITLPGPDGSKTVYDGVLLRDLLQKAGAPLGDKLRGKALASYVLASASDGYKVAFTLGELDPQFGNAPILVADTRDGKPLPSKQGPFRLVCANDKEGARSVRMLESLHVVQLAK
jgi:DMSO/TMAO reductase YedYZ molybdopterin-dependent catalytic subunit